MKSESTKKYHIGIAGNIGSGKTTLTQMLSKHYGWEPQFEDIDDNPYLFDFYEDMQRWSFNLQIYFLQSRLKQYAFIQGNKKSVVQDRTIYEDAEVFARNLVEMNLMAKRDFDNYYHFYQQILTLIQAPDILIYLRGNVSILVEQIQKRGRKYEENIRLDYLRRLNEKYEGWIRTYQEKSHIIVIDMEQKSFEQDRESFGKITQKIDTYINGLF